MDLPATSASAVRQIAAHTKRQNIKPAGRGTTAAAYATLPRPWTGRLPEGIPARVQYPYARRDDAVENVHGTPVADPYRWLEDPASSQTHQWVREQNALSGSYLAALPERAWFEQQVTRLLNRPRSGTPYKKAGRYFVCRNDGAQAQDVWCWAPTLERLAEGGKVLVDPNRLDETGATSIAATGVSESGRYFAYALSYAGSDWNTIRIRDIDERRDLDDELTLTKLSSPVWLPDDRSFVYLHYPSAENATGDVRQHAGLLKLHRLGTAQTDDQVLIDTGDDSRLHAYPEVSYDGRWLIVEVYSGTSSSNRLWAFPLTTGGRTEVGPAVRMFDEPDARYDSVRVIGDEMLVRTNRDAPQFRLVRVPIAPGVHEMTDVIPQQDGLLDSVTSAGGALVTVHLDDAMPVLHRYSLDGRFATSIPMAGTAVVELNGGSTDTELFVGMSSATVPLKSFRVDLETFDIVKLAVSMRRPAGQRPPSWQPPIATVGRGSARSADGTMLRYFLIHREDLALDRPRPTMLYGYGGLNVRTLADFRPGWPAWLEAGGVLVIANLRGGGEYGVDWYHAGRGLNKQRTFDDMIAVAEELIEQGITTAPQIALHGRSAGGLVVGAVLTQRPDLIGAAMPMVGLLDMLRFDQLPSGASWTAHYGSPADAKVAATVLGYSPLHNIRDGVEYPATLVLTGDHDDRIVPAHSYKFTAALQHAQGGSAPVLARIETGTGHGKGKPRAMVAAEWIDLLAFAAHHTGLRPPQPPAP